MDVCVYPPLNFENGHVGRSTPPAESAARSDARHERSRAPGRRAGPSRATSRRTSRRTGRANLHRDRARVSPPSPPIPRSCQPMPARASPSKRHGRAPDRALGIEPSGRMVQSSPLPARPLACRRLTPGQKDACGRPNPRRRKSLPRPPHVSAWVPLCYPLPPDAAEKGVPPGKIYFAKNRVPPCVHVLSCAIMLASWQR